VNPTCFWYDLPYWLQRFDLSTPPSELLDQYSHHIRLEPHVAETIAMLSEKYLLVIASNAARLFVETELRHVGLEKCFTHVVSATSDFQMVKKAEGFYLRLCRILGVSPAEMVHIGDHEVFDVEIPLRAGIDAYHYAPRKQSKGRTIRDFKELWGLL